MVVAGVQLRAVLQMAMRATKSRVSARDDGASELRRRGAGADSAENPVSVRLVVLDFSNQAKTVNPITTPLCP
jgi:hypothetical protein